ncbi:hypothetical protein ACG3SL_13800 [Sphingomonas sp. CJ20]
MAWSNVHIGKEGDRVTIDGVRLWKTEWRWQNAKTIPLPNPLEPGQLHSFMICEAGNTRQPARFAACKLHGDLWAFYVQD